MPDEIYIQQKEDLKKFLLDQCNFILKEETDQILKVTYEVKDKYILERKISKITLIIKEDIIKKIDVKKIEKGREIFKDCTNIDNYYEIKVYSNIYQKKDISKKLFEKPIKLKKAKKSRNQPHAELGILSLDYFIYLMKNNDEKFRLLISPINFFEDICPEYEFDIEKIRKESLYLTLKIFNINEKDLNELRRIIDNIIFHYSINCDLLIDNYPQYKTLKNIRDIKGDNFDIKYPEIIYPFNALEYYKIANSSNNPITKFIFFYQVIESYFNESNRKNIRDELNKIKNRPIKLEGEEMETLITTIMQSKIKHGKECEQLINLIEQCFKYEEINKIIEKIELELDKKIYSNPSECKKRYGDKITEIQLKRDHVISNLSTRIYSIRCALVHGKDDNYDFSLLPNQETFDYISDENILMKWLAEEIMIRTNNWQLLK